MDSETNSELFQILVVGDPGLGKSQMLLACASVAARGVFVTATGVTTSGLTVTLTREAGNEFVLEAGALVLADQGNEDLHSLQGSRSQFSAESVRLSMFLPKEICCTLEKILSLLS